MLFPSPRHTPSAIRQWNAENRDALIDLFVATSMPIANWALPVLDQPAPAKAGPQAVARLDAFVPEERLAA